MASPAARLLKPSDGSAPGTVLALFGRVGRSPRVYNGRDADVLLQMMQSTAMKKLGITLTGALVALKSYSHSSPKP